MRFIGIEIVYQIRLESPYYHTLSTIHVIIYILLYIAFVDLWFTTVVRFEYSQKEAAGPSR